MQRNDQHKIPNGGYLEEVSTGGRSGKHREGVGDTNNILLLKLDGKLMVGHFIIICNEINIIYSLSNMSTSQ